jgi:uncharacterized membrane protein
MEKYQPGVCNIGKNERRKRYGIAVVGFAVTLLVVYLILSFDLPRLVLLLSFCAGFAAAGISDLSGSGGSRSKVTNQEFHRKDMQKARQIHIYSIVSSIIIVALIYLFA